MPVLRSHGTQAHGGFDTVQIAAQGGLINQEGRLP
jgi:hypothetical protein